MVDQTPVYRPEGAPGAALARARLKSRQASDGPTGTLATYSALRMLDADDVASDDQHGHPFRGALAPTVSVRRPEDSQGSPRLGNGSSPYGHWNRLSIRAGAHRNNASKVKPLVDIQIALLLVLLFLPLMLGIAALIKLSSPGPLLYKQTRYGYGRRKFEIYKFRTMRVLESGSTFRQATRPDHRVTAVGRILRRMSLDELPQLFNVLQGTMSLVGPRPHPVGLDDHHLSLIDGYEERFLVKPGISGLAQIRGFRGPTSSLADMSARVASDREYIARWSLLLDGKILLRSFRVFADSNAF